MRVLIASAVLAASLAIAVPGSAEEDTDVNLQPGNALLDHCLDEAYDEKSMFNQGFCAGFIVGASDQTQALKLGGVPILQPFDFCLPGLIPVQQLQDIVVKALQRAPEVRHHPAALIVNAAFANAFPCGE